MGLADKLDPFTRFFFIKRVKAEEQKKEKTATLKEKIKTKAKNFKPSGSFQCLEVKRELRIHHAMIC